VLRALDRPPAWGSAPAPGAPRAKHRWRWQDNVLRPMLIKRGADLPLLLIFAGVIGGLIAFGDKASRRPERVPGRAKSRARGTAPARNRTRTP
jgi:hypothetical protein